ncbi:MAG: hypothetical protein MUO42_10795 [Anaerolineaceae bacterium]|jgi:flagellar basal body-associated protein FliL|nr:hypothetical protein [Anaerolineaceae bacterium]
MNKQPPNEPVNPVPSSKWREILKIILLSLVWVALMAISFYTYYTIPILIFITWWIVAWVIKASKKDDHDGSAYDDEN